MMRRADESKITALARGVKLNYRPFLPFAESSGSVLAPFVPVKKVDERN